MGFEPTHAFTRLPRFQHGLLSLLSNLPKLYMEPVGVSESQSIRCFQLFGSVLGTVSKTFTTSLLTLLV